MVNSNFSTSQVQRWAKIIVAVVVSVSAVSLPAMAQKPYYNNTYKIYPQSHSSRVARASGRANGLPNQPVTARPQPFNVDVVDPPAPFPTLDITDAPLENQSGQFSNLSKAFAANEPAKVTHSGRIQDIFGENSQDQIFGEQESTPQETVPVNPFEKLDPVVPPTTTQDPTPLPPNPFGEMTPREDQSQEPTTPIQNPFNELPQDPTPNTPPMDTDPRGSNQIEPRLPPGSEFTPDPGQINPNPPIPGEEPRPRDDEPGNVSGNDEPRETESPDLTDQKEPGELPDTSERSVFDSKEPDEKDLAPVPAPRSSHVYLPARDPTDYVQSQDAKKGAVPPGYDPRMMPNNPYANLPGPYGYGARPGYPPQPSYPGYPPQPPYPGYVPPYPNAMPQMPYGGQCGPGCTPTQLCNSCNNCNSTSIASSGCGGCNQCNSCCGTGSRPTLVGEDIGNRIVETATVDECGDAAYVDVVSDCDNVCTNFASCYIGLFGGWSDLNDFTTRGELGTGVYFEDAGYLFGFTVGQFQGRNLRTELELSYRNININGLQLDGVSGSEFTSVAGDFGTFAGMLNGYWEFVDFGSEKIKPYVGGGVGFALARPDLIQSNGVEAVINDDESSFAWQWMAGLNYKASPTLDAFVEYRYFTADSFRLDTQLPEVAGVGNGSGPFDYRSSTVLFGMRARF
ncbi:outer membrane beta-barrel protein [Mariniblastus fucicola]|uniref:Uncharacterized protein n=1 Tax=Mariniblastus fucicola TaxID=980251 RepID=A0A5B9P826_9BACT|nr:outer membrane beta-barrel protein [Mariniblastus fucicola]QEG22448.1 hypothetical protein MFFC18_23280 [Mariniblastus fucicola]